MGANQQNIEIKVRLRDADHLRIEGNIRSLVPGVIDPTTDVDTYFRVPHGRLKLRVSNDDRAGTLIYYERPNEATSRLSLYRLVSIPDARALRDTLAEAVGVLVTVNKRRSVFIYGQTRIHLDNVENLGYFIELETVLGTQSDEAALAEHRYVFNTLGLDACEAVPQSYSDLLLLRDIAP